MTNSHGNSADESRWLQSALLFTFFAHAAAMILMGLFLLRGMPGGSSTSVAARVGYVAAHPWLWRLGWSGWQLTAVSDLLLALALIATPWIPRRASVLTLALTLAGLLPDQFGQYLWTWKGPAAAVTALASGGYEHYLMLEHQYFLLVAGWGTVGYLAAALGWTWCFTAGGAWSRQLTWLSAITWSLFIAATILLFLPATRSHPALGLCVSAANAVAFVLLLAWLSAVTERVLRRTRPMTTTGSSAPWRHPGAPHLARAYDLIANSRFARSIGELLPILPMASDIQDVVYVNYLLPVHALSPLLPSYLQLQCVGPQSTHAIFTFLTYRHGHFGPIIFGPLRRLWPSPIQSNWRVYVFDPQTGKRGVHFVTTAITSTPHALASRLLSEGVPMHVPAAASLERDGNGTLNLRIYPGAGTAPDVIGTFKPAPNTALPPPWDDCFESWAEVLATCVPQDRALSAQPWYRRVVRQEIDLDIPLSACQPLDAEVESNSARAIAGNAQPLCFVVPRVAFRFYGEAFDVRDSPGPTP